jgi:hypothetical protein
MSWTVEELREAFRYGEVFRVKKKLPFNDEYLVYKLWRKEEKIFANMRKTIKMRLPVFIAKDRNYEAKEGDLLFKSHDKAISIIGVKIDGL